MYVLWLFNGFLAVGRQMKEKVVGKDESKVGGGRLNNYSMLSVQC